MHGFAGDGSNWIPTVAWFRANGYTAAETWAYGYNWTADNKANARGPATYVDQVRARTAAAGWTS